MTTIAKVLTASRLVEGADGVEEGDPAALLDHAAGELVRHLEVEGAGHDALGLDQAEEAVQLRGDAVVRLESVEHVLPCRRNGLFAACHRSPYSSSCWMPSSDDEVTPS